MGFTAAVTIATALLFGTAPALRSARVAPIDALKEHGRSAGGDSRVSVSSGLVIAQVALSLVLIVAAGLFVRSFTRLANVRLGFDRDQILVVNVNALRSQVEPAARMQLFQRLSDAVARTSGRSLRGGIGGHARQQQHVGLNVNVTGAPDMSERDRTCW